MSLLALMGAVGAQPALAEEPAPPTEPSPVVPDPAPDAAPPRTSPKPKPAVKAAPTKVVTVTPSAPSRTAPAASPPTPRSAVVEPAPARVVRHRSQPARAAKRRPPVQQAEPTPRPRRELPFASFVLARTLATPATAAPPPDPEPIDLTWPALFVLGAALAAAAAAAVSAAAPSFRLALVGGLSDRPNLSRSGHIERRVRRPRRPSPVIPELQPPEPPPPLAPGTYEIEWFRGYVKSRFFVLLEDPDGEARLVESPWFSWRQAEPPPPLPDFVAARDALRAKLEREGWHECGRGQAWFSQRVTAGDRP